MTFLPHRLRLFPERLSLIADDSFASSMQAIQHSGSTQMGSVKFEMASIGKVSADAGARVHVFLVKRMIPSPPHWRAYTAHAVLRWQAVKIAPGKVSEVPDDQRGVYSFV